MLSSLAGNQILYCHVPLYLFGVMDKSSDPCGDIAGSEDIPLSRDCGDNLVWFDVILIICAMMFCDVALANRLL